MIWTLAWLAVAVVGCAVVLARPLARTVRQIRRMRAMAKDIRVQTAEVVEMLAYARGLGLEACATHAPQASLDVRPYGSELWRRCGWTNEAGRRLVRAELDSLAARGDAARRREAAAFAEAVLLAQEET